MSGKPQVNPNRTNISLAPLPPQDARPGFTQIGQSTLCSPISGRAAGRVGDCGHPTVNRRSGAGIKPPRPPLMRRSWAHGNSLLKCGKAQRWPPGEKAPPTPHTGGRALRRALITRFEFLHLERPGMVERREDTPQDVHGFFVRSNLMKLPKDASFHILPPRVGTNWHLQRA